MVPWFRCGKERSLRHALRIQEHICFQLHGHVIPPSSPCPFVQAWERSIDHLQCGGRAGVGADIAHHVVQCHQAWAQHHSMPTAILFIDIRSAFYTVLRQAFTAVPNDDSNFIAAMMQLGVTPQEVAQVTQVAASDNASHHQAILHDMMRHTFYASRHDTVSLVTPHEAHARVTQWRTCCSIYVRV